MRPIDADILMDIAEQQGHVTIDDILNAPTVTPPPNLPLTPGELREMDGEKVCIRYVDDLYDDEYGAYFGKFEQLVSDYNGKLTACDMPLEYYDTEWLAYRRKPDGGAP